MKSRQHKLSTAEVFVSGAGKLPCKYVIHTVGPQWQGGRRNEEGELFDAIHNCLKAASDHQCVSLALPAVSSGVFGFPLPLCCQVITEAIGYYCKQETQTTLRKICIIDNQRNVIESFNSAFEELNLKPGPVPETLPGKSWTLSGAGKENVQVFGAAMAQADGRIVFHC